MLKVLKITVKQPYQEEPETRETKKVAMLLSPCSVVSNVSWPAASGRTPAPSHEKVPPQNQQRNFIQNW